MCSLDEWWAAEGCEEGRSGAPGSHPDLQPRTRHFLTSRKLGRPSSSDRFSSADLLFLTVDSTPAKRTDFQTQRLCFHLSRPLKSFAKPECSVCPSWLSLGEAPR